MIRVVRHPYGPRCYVLSYRVHHGAAGLGAIALSAICHGRARAILALIGARAIADDWRDFPFTDRRNHNPKVS